MMIKLLLLLILICITISLVSCDMIEMKMNAVISAHFMPTQSLCQLNSQSCCNGLSCPHANAICCNDGKHCCPAGSVCLPSDINSTPRCGFPLKLPNQIKNKDNCKCPSPPPCQQELCQPSPPCDCMKTVKANNKKSCECKSNQPCDCKQPNNNNNNKQCKCQPAPPCVKEPCQSAPPCSCNQKVGANNGLNPLAQQIEAMLQTQHIIPPSVLEAYNDVVSPVLVQIRINGYDIKLYNTGTPQRYRFTRQLIHDVATALGIPDTQLHVSNLEAGIIADIKILPPLPVFANQQSPLDLSRNLERMVKDKYSILKHGRITQYTDSNYFHSQLIWEHNITNKPPAVITPTTPAPTSTPKSQPAPKPNAKPAPKPNAKPAPKPNAKPAPKRSATSPIKLNFSAK